MPHKYVSKGVRNVIDSDTLAKAIKKVLNGQMSIRHAAAAYNINYSSLQRFTINAKKGEKKPESSNGNQKQCEISVRSSLGGKPVCSFFYKNFAFKNVFLSKTTLLMIFEYKFTGFQCNPRNGSCELSKNMFQNELWALRE